MPSLFRDGPFDSRASPLRDGHLISRASPLRDGYFSPTHVARPRPHLIARMPTRCQPRKSGDSPSSKR